MKEKTHRFFVSPDQRHVSTFAPKTAWMDFYPMFCHASSMCHKDYLRRAQLGYLGLTMQIFGQIQVLLQKTQILSLNQSKLSLLKHFCHTFDQFLIHFGFFLKKAVIMYLILTLLKMSNLNSRLELQMSLKSKDLLEQYGLKQYWL